VAKRLEQKLAQIAELRRGEPTPAAIQTLQSIVAKDEGAAVARAAELMVEWGLFDQQAHLAQAFKRLLAGGAEADPQCWGKVALIKALRTLGWHDPEVYLLGCRCVQLEPVWGGQEDSAPSLRALSAQALAECPGVSYDRAIDALVILLADPAWNVRAGAAQAIASQGYPQGAPLLKLKVLLGDLEPRVVGACLEGLLHLARTEALPFLRELLGHKDTAVRLEAVCALAASSLPEAVNLATSTWKTLTDPRSRKAMIAALASSHTPEALDFLLELLSKASRSEALAVLGAIGPRLREPELLERARQAIAQNPSPALRDELEAQL
jgi:hypothetical protein